MVSPGEVPDEDQVPPLPITDDREQPRKIGIDAFVETTPHGRSHEGRSDVSLDQVEALTLCSDRSVPLVEISARMRLPLDATRRLVAEMQADSLVVVHEPARFDDDETASVELLERALNGLRTLAGDEPRRPEPSHAELGDAEYGRPEPAQWSAWWADMLARRTGEEVWVGMLSRGEVHVVHHAFRPDDVVQALDVESAIPWHACALGQAIAASLDDKAQKALLAAPAARLTGRTVTDPEALRQLLAVTLARGYAVEAHAATLGDATIAAPVLDSSDRVVAAIGIIGPADRLMSEEWHQDLVDAVCTAAVALSQDLGAGRTAGLPSA